MTAEQKLDQFAATHTAAEGEPAVKPSDDQIRAIIEACLADGMPVKAIASGLTARLGRGYGYTSLYNRGLVPTRQELVRPAADPGDVALLRGVIDDEAGEWDWNGPLPGALSRVLDTVDGGP